MKSAVLFVGLELLAASAQSTASCDSLSLSACAQDCRCQRVACCCGTGCTHDEITGAVQYGVCADVDAATFPGCPSYGDCKAQNQGLFRTFAACANPPTTQPTPQPNSAPTADPNKKTFEFGTTFPLIGTQLVPQTTWQGNNIYLGTGMQFNKGAYFQYTDSFSAPIWTNYDPATGSIPTPAATPNQPPTPPPPTPVVDYTGKECYSYMQPCPNLYYCKVTQGYNPSQKGFCAKEQQNSWMDASQGWWQDQWGSTMGQYGSADNYNAYTYNGQAGGANGYATIPMVHPPLIFDPNHNGQGAGWSPYYTAGGTSSSAESCAGPSKCGYKAAVGSCWCDDQCQGTGDCCADIQLYCPVAGSVVPAASAGACSNAGSCVGYCGKAEPAPGGCHCDNTCQQYGDCCCDQTSVC